MVQLYTHTGTDAGNQLHIVGLGVTDEVLLTQKVLDLFCDADFIIGSERHQSLVQPVLAQEVLDRLNLQWIKLPKLAELKALVEQERTDKKNKKIILLASGDPLFYGIGRWAKENILDAHLSFYPAVSSVQAACHLLGLSLQDVDVLSLHGRPFATIRTCLKPNQTLVVLTDKNSQPIALAQACIDAGFSQSELWVCQNLGYPNQSVKKFYVNDLIRDMGSDAFLDNSSLLISPLHISVIRTKGEGQVLPVFPGIPDKDFLTAKKPGQGMISKREVRLVVLSYLQPGNDDIIWDVGAGCGGVAVELAYWNDRVNVFAVEYKKERLHFLEGNRLRFGVVKNLHIVSGKAPKVLTEIPAANKVFIGGSDGEIKSILNLVWGQLPLNGVLVVSAVTERTKNQFNEFLSKLDSENLSTFETVEINVARGEFFSSESKRIEYKQKLPVTLFKLVKYSIS